MRVGYFLRETIVSLRRNLFMTLAGIITVTVSLFLFGGVMLVSTMVDHGTARWKNGVELEVFFKTEATDQQIQDVQDELAAKQSPDVKRYRFLSKNDAYQEAKRIFHDQPDILANVDPNSLPASFRVVPKKADLTEEIAARFRGRPGVDSVLTAEKQVHDMLHGIRIVRLIFFAASTALLASSLFLIVNTIRLATFARRREIEVMKLVGATNWFIRVPFMLEGFIEGAVGAAVAFGLLFALKSGALDRLGNNHNLLQHFFVTNSDTVGIGLEVVVIGALVGAVGSAIGLRRFLEV
jgi:cell division transport system permease protein